jgi:recombinational DNA repair protein (RecF pathway)
MMDYCSLCGRRIDKDEPALDVNTSPLYIKPRLVCNPCYEEIRAKIRQEDSDKALGFLVELLKKLAELYGPEEAHLKADIALLEYINNQEVTDAFDSIEKWYS